MLWAALNLAMPALYGMFSFGTLDEDHGRLVPLLPVLKGFAQISGLRSSSLGPEYIREIPLNRSLASYLGADRRVFLYSISTSDMKIEA